MQLITPDAGLLFWMVVIFGLVVEVRVPDHYRYGREAERHHRAVAEGRPPDRGADGRYAGGTRPDVGRRPQGAGTDPPGSGRHPQQADCGCEGAGPRGEAAKILADARTEIEAEKEAALRDVRKEVAVLSVSIAEKILRKELAKDGEQREYIDRMVEETVREEARS